jgi:hypothetical protein
LKITLGKMGSEEALEANGQGGFIFQPDRDRK